MEKTTIYLIALLIVCITLLGLGGEYFSYKYSVYQSSSQATTTVTTQSPAVAPATTPTQQSSGSSENSILSFDFNNPMAVGNINESNHSVIITVPPDTDVTNIAPTIIVSNNATISPASNSAQDFTNPVTYTVTAQNGAIQKYLVTVNVPSVLKSAGNEITSFTLSGFNPEVDGYIDNTAHTIMAVVPDGTDLTKLTPIIQVSDGATISPGSGDAQDFTNPVTYTVTDIYGDIQTYTVTVVTESNSG